ncbi:MAG: CocE/NonD family hydrolase [Candidatus Sigynarchaeota archaeon]
MGTTTPPPEPGSILNVKDRPPRLITDEEIMIPINLFKNVDIMSPLFSTLGPITSSAIKSLLLLKLETGTPYRIKDVMIPMRDGVKVALDVYFPKKSSFKCKQKLSTILIRMPYWKDKLPIIGQAFAQHGYVVVVQDIRGTGHSNKTGINSFTILEREDGQDVIAWIKKQFWYNGKIGTWGASYLGMTQWVVHDSEDITCFGIQVSSPRNLWGQHNGLSINELSAALSRIQCDGMWFYDPMNIGKQERMHYFQYTTHYLHNPAKSMYNLPVGKEKFTLLDMEAVKKKEMVSILKAVFGLDLHASKPEREKYQRFVMELIYGSSVGHLSRFMPGMFDFKAKNIKRPYLIVGGWYDMFIRLSLEDFCDIRANADPFARKNIKMVVGPWAHGEIRHPDVKHVLHGGFADFIKNVINFDWYDYWLKDDCPEERARIEKTLINTPPLKIFTLGANTWRWEHEWPLARTRYQNLYLHSSGAANSRKGDGTLSFDEPTTDEQPDKYLHDPANPVITAGGNNLLIPKGAFDQHLAESRDDVLVYTSAPLTRGIEMTGPVKCELYASTTAVDTDFIVKICDVYPNGKSYNIDDLGLRARYRAGVLKPPSLLEPGKCYKFEFDLWPTSILFKKGHRIRVSIASSDFPKYSVHSNLANGNKGEYTIARQTIYHDKDRPSCVVLPVIP